MTVAPAAAASWTATLPTPPVAPTMSTVSPSDSSSASTLARAVTAASEAAPAVARSTPAGLGTMDMPSGTTMRSAQVPACTAGAIAARNPNTSSPGEKPVTPSPTSSTTPA